ncbi:MAG: exosortase/archaeosortase family protein [Lentisphaeria bacterium]|nr:exosortase/archaeosortase family protein [Lentisphaeria bacterium]
MSMKKIDYSLLKKHPLGALYGTLLGIVAFSAAVPMFTSGMWDAALVDLAMAGILITLMLKSFSSTPSPLSGFPEKCTAWGMLVLANILAGLPTHEFPGSLSTAFAFTLLLCALVLYFSGRLMAFNSAVPALWCCVFMPYHEEFMLLLSFPLRLSATVLSAGILKVFGMSVIYSGTSLHLPGVNIAITDACSGINQLDAFLLIAIIAVQMLHKKLLWKMLHFAFIIPAIILGNSLRIVLTVLLYQQLGEVVLQGNWHIALGYVQIVLAFLIFIAIGKIFTESDGKTEEERQ